MQTVLIIAAIVVGWLLLACGLALVVGAVLRRAGERLHASDRSAPGPSGALKNSGAPELPTPTEPPKPATALPPPAVPAPREPALHLCVRCLAADARAEPNPSPPSQESR